MKKEYIHPVLFAKLSKENWIPLKIHRGEIIKVKCSFCGKVFNSEKMKNHTCENRELL